MSVSSGLLIDANKVQVAPVGLLFGALAMAYLFMNLRRVFQLRRQTNLQVGDGTQDILVQEIRDSTPR